MRLRFCARSCSAASPALRPFRTLKTRLLIGHDPAIRVSTNLSGGDPMMTWGGTCKELGLAGSVAGGVFGLWGSAGGGGDNYQRLLSGRGGTQEQAMGRGPYNNLNHSGAEPEHKKK